MTLSKLGFRPVIWPDFSSGSSLPPSLSCPSCVLPTTTSTSTTGTVQGSDTDPNGSFDLSKTFGFNSYSTFTGKVDWKFSHKNHLYLAASPFSQTRQTVLNRTIDFQGQTFNVGLSTSAKLTSWAFAPGYQ